MYRAVALAFLNANAEATAEGAAAVLPTLEVDVQYQEETMHVFVDGEDVTDSLRSAEVGSIVSQISTLAPVRERMVEEQRRIGYEQEEKRGGVVLDGRDTGTVVFPDADLKIFMVADLEERARRRKKEYDEKGEKESLEKIQQKIAARDRRDRNREIAPLRRSEEAINLDTTHRTIEEQVDFVVDRVKQHRLQGT